MNHNPEAEVKIKPSTFMRAWSGLFTIGGTAVCLFLIFQGFQFSSAYSILYIGAGVIFLPIMSYLTVWGLPGFLPGKVLFSIYPGENGTIVSKKISIKLSDIQDIDLERNRFTLYNNVAVKTTNRKKYVIKTYNALNDFTFYERIDEFVYPYMNPEAKKTWDHKVSNHDLLKSLKFERKHGL
ncbi:DUF5381 family protein [Metabacillus indicus]|uniref:DUF5381 family protein n=1 Tax=Metabacillus indicus TaxID=246786 RepID=UPI003CF70E7C